MGEETDQIEDHLETKREDLHSNLKELEAKVKSATDWRQYFQKHTGTMVAAAFGGGLLVSAMVGKNRRADVSQAPASAPSAPSARTQGNGTHEVLETWDTIKTALVGVAAAKFKGMLGEVVPGFSEHLAKSEAKMKGRTPTNGQSAESVIEG
jgi:hypothetical protein